MPSAWRRPRKVKRPSSAVVGLDLSETLEIVALVGPEKPKASDALIIWVASPSVETVDEAQGALFDEALVGFGGHADSATQFSVHLHGYFDFFFFRQLGIVLRPRRSQEIEALAERLP